MNSYSAKFAIVLLLVSVISSCSDKNKQQADQTKVDAISKSDTISLSESLAKRFKNTYDNHIVTFNDGTTMDISKPLQFDSIKEVSHTFFVGDWIEPANQLDLDENGVIMLNGTYHPTTIARTALKAINSYKKSKLESEKKIFLDQVKWGEENFYQTANYGFWYFSEPAPLYNLDSGWTSAFSQGFFLNVFLEAYRLTKDEKYTIIIEKALKAYMVPVENGGFLRDWEEGELWFEEYGTERPSRVLNGTIYGLEGVYNVYRDLNSQLALKIFESGVETIKNHLEDYDAKYTSRYSLADWKNEISQENYHEGHVIQLLWLYEVSGDEIFKKYAQIFLNSDLGGFMTRSIYKLDKPKITTVEASFCIDCEKHGPENLTDELWAHGNYWSAHKPADLIVDFGDEKENISGVTLYHVSAQSVNVNFDIFAFNSDTNEWSLVQKFDTKHIKDRVAGYNETGKFETFIEHYKIFEPLNGRKLKISFYADANNIIAIRELNFNYDRKKELDYIISRMNNRIANP